ncbi:hypothetical protein [Belliella aquatica]|nr:hypothetical protein [Belliella aquatica]MCH7407711.1 hypothetical protein [Belliella aquatica]
MFSIYSNFRKGKFSQGLTIQLFIIIGLIYSSVGSLQAQQVKELQSYMAEENIGKEDRLYKMIYGATPTIVIANNTKVNPKEAYPQKVDIDGSSLRFLNEKDPLFRTVKMIQIHITNSSQFASISLGTSLFESFSNLEYIFILSDVALTSQEVLRMSAGFENTDILIFYQVAIPQ